MWTVLRTKTALAATCGLTSLFSAHVATAQNAQNNFVPNYGFQNQTYSHGLFLPQVPQPNGQDEIRAADGTTCKTSMASNDAYLDVGGLGGQDIDGQFNNGTVYGRLIVPLGTVPNRLDCSQLYQLEVQRLKHEVELLRSGIGGAGGVSSSSGGSAGKSKNWADSGWSQGSVAAPSPSEKSATSALKTARKSAPATKTSLAVSPASDGIIPSRLGGPATSSFAAQPDVRSQIDPLVYAKLAYDAERANDEVLPWSTQPAEAGKILVGMSARKPRSTARDETPDQLGRPAPWGG